MENITITPRNKRQSDVIKSLFKEMDIPFIEKGNHTIIKTQDELNAFFDSLLMK